MQDDPVVLAEVAAVLDHGEEGADAVRGHDRVHLYARPRALHAEREVLAIGATVADHAPEVGDRVRAQAAAVRRLAEHDAVEVEQDGGTADERRERREDGLQALLLEHDLGELLVHGEAALQQGVLLVDDLGRDRLADGEERDVVRDLEQREAVLFGDAHQRRRNLVEAEAGAEPEAGDVVVDEPLDLLDLVRLVAGETVAGGEEQLAALEPLGGVGHLADVHPADGVADGGLAGQQPKIELRDLEDVLDGDHRSPYSTLRPRTMRGDEPAAALSV